VRDFGYPAFVTVPLTAAPPVPLYFNVPSRAHPRLVHRRTTPVTMSEADAMRSEEAWTEEHIGDFIHVTLDLGSSQGSINKSLAECNMGETHIFPTSVPDWSNLEILQRNKLPARASFYIYDSLKDALARDVSKSKTLSLSGTWKFKVSPNPFDSHGELNPPQPDLGNWGDIKVPGMWQLQGYGRGPQ
jgi:hypothetical protein